MINVGPGQNSQGGVQPAQNVQQGQGGQASQNQADRDGRRRWVVVIPVLCGIGVIIALIYITQVPRTERWSALGLALAVAAASALVGGIVGFLFGIPLTNQKNSQNSGESTNGSLKANTGLEQVSDWLTKIIVGVGLVQLGHALPALGRLGRSLNAPLGGIASSSAFGLSLALYFAVLGFLFGYLWSREILPGEFAEGLAGVIKKQLATADSERSSALSVVNQQLNSAKSGTAPSPAELIQAVAAAPDSTRILIFNQAEELRKKVASQISHDLGNSPRQEKLNDPTVKTDQQTLKPVIPVFQALIAADTANQDHRNHGSLGWTLKDTAGPVSSDASTWRQATAGLTTAISMRGTLPGSGWRLYEANRAVCNIQLYQTADDAAKATLATQIWADLDQAEADAYAKPMVDLASPTVDPDINQWCTAHPAPPPAAGAAGGGH
jgi:hypothetical protein